MMRPASSITIKSRTFSQISASVRGSSVPSPEYDEISSWIRAASGRKASRVCMGLLAKRTCLLPRGSDGLMDPRRGRAAGHVMNSEHVVELHEIEKVLIEMRINGLQFREWQVLQLTFFCPNQPYGTFDPHISGAKPPAPA